MTRLLIKFDTAWMRFCRRHPWAARALYVALLLAVLAWYAMASAHGAGQQVVRPMV